MDVSARPTLNQEIVNNRFAFVFGLSGRETSVMDGIFIRLLRGVDVEDRAELDLALAKVKKFYKVMRDVNAHRLEELVPNHCDISTLVSTTYASFSCVSFSSLLRPFSALTSCMRMSRRLRF